MLKRAPENPGELIRVSSRRLPEGGISQTASFGVWVKNNRLGEVGRALRVLQNRKPGASLSTLVCDAIVKAANS